MNCWPLRRPEQLVHIWILPSAHQDTWSTYRWLQPPCLEVALCALSKLAQTPAHILELLQGCTSVTECRNTQLHERLYPGQPLFADEGRVSRSLPAVGSCPPCCSAVSELLPSTPTLTRALEVNTVVRHLGLCAAKGAVSVQLTSATGCKKRKTVCVNQPECLPATLYDSVVNFVKLGVTSGATYCFYKPSPYAIQS